MPNDPAMPQQPVSSMATVRLGRRAASWRELLASVSALA